MTNYPINEAETIFEPFYDSINSSLFDFYTVTYANGTIGKAYPHWAHVCVSIDSQETDDYAIKIERDCNLDIENYDIFRLFAAIDTIASFRICCVIDGKNITVIEREKGLGDIGEYEGKISGKKITHFSLEFRNNANHPTIIELRWLGLANQKLQEKMEAKGSPYDKQWEGCFKENPQIGPMIGIYFGERELVELRNRLNKEPFLAMTNVLRNRAEKAMELEPEPYITNYIPRHDHRWVRDRDMKRPMYQEDMDVLAFIGLLDQNLEMLHMACRKMLSVAVVPQWSESIIGTLPGTTWHHVAFTEQEHCAACALVLDWAGSLLTKYGKALVYDALIMKGLPRIECAFRTHEYIRSMNQGIVFNHGRILALKALSQIYPRYKERLKEAEQDEREMIDTYIMPDGGTLEGPSYWNFTFSNAICTIAVLARNAGMTLQEYAWDKLKLTGNYALALLSDTKDGTYCMPINDAHTIRYARVLSSVFSTISDDLRWKKLYSRSILNTPTDDISLESLLLSSEVEMVTDEEISKDGFIHFKNTGLTSLRRTTKDIGRVHCCMTGGPVKGHFNDDKGQIILEVDHIPMLIDRGKCSYSNPNQALLEETTCHNLFTPIAPEGHAIFQQKRQNCQPIILRASYENNVLDYCIDTTGAWEDGIIEKITRTIHSDDPHEFLIYDDAVFTNEYESCFRLHTRGNIAKDGDTYTITDSGYKITVTPINYIPSYAEYGEDGVDEDVLPVNSLRMYLSKSKECHLITKLTIGRSFEHAT